MPLAAHFVQKKIINLNRSIELTSSAEVELEPFSHMASKAIYLHDAAALFQKSKN